MLLPNLARRFLSWFVLAARLPHRLITRDDGQPYLHRWYLIGEPGGLAYFEEGERKQRWWQKLTSRLPCFYLHRFVSSDTDAELHSHPWQAASTILVGGYVEERRVGSTLFDEYYDSLHGYKVISQEFRAGSRNFLFADTFHKVTLLEQDCWSIIQIGNRVASWGFWSPLTGKFVPWREHLALRTAKKVTTKGGTA